MPDFNGDGRDDILWYNQNAGTLSNWLGRADGGFIINDANAMNMVESTWTPNWYWEILGTGDFNGDGYDDIIWTNDSIEFSNWLGTETGGFVINDANAFTQFTPFSNTNSTPYFAGTGDFNGDGYDDVLWWDYYYTVDVWSGSESGGFVKNPAVPITTNSGSWIPIGVGDFNGDGLADILWRGDGAVSNWLSAGGGNFTVNDVNAFHQVPNAWQVAGVGDFNGDGRDDILWRNWQTGALSNWLGTAVGGFVINDPNALVVVPTDWFVAGVGDYNGDGRDDILWRNQDGALSNWLGTETGGWLINDAAAFTRVETSWQIGSNWDPWDY